MKQLSIITDQKILRQKSEAVLDMNDAEIQELIEEMFKILKERKGIGLAAVQIGRPIRIFVVDYENQKRAFINPEITKFSNKKAVIEEGCLSVPGIFLQIERPARVGVSAVDRYGKKFNLKADGMLARVIQHEHDHLEGKLFVDKKSPLSLGGGD